MIWELLMNAPRLIFIPVFGLLSLVLFVLAGINIMMKSRRGESRQYLISNLRVALWSFWGMVLALSCESFYTNETPGWVQDVATDIQSLFATGGFVGTAVGLMALIAIPFVVVLFLLPLVEVPARLLSHALGGEGK
ncbi:hypothetical protein JSO19_03920 [Leucobacter sp. UCMA 4100]|uniref:hypothetical protein n=1 Tax=Leucobacter sp. UCMA 4100 TaxID=2810534 RepID=UPI0022EB633A|nr:hypothetical protein [Leucobacter sp. UCMA 4100]MDA3146523.1 hypothetical protein [Leucobacter sp. UCMA 4100]